MAPDAHPFDFSALLSRDVGDGETTHGVRGGHCWGSTAEDARGRLAARYLADGWSIVLLDVQPIAPGSLGELAAYAGQVPASPKRSRRKSNTRPAGA